MADACDKRDEQRDGGESSEAGTKTKLIKRYSNRKLYDTVESRYVTLEEVGEMIRAGDDVRIVDNRSKGDLTSVTLAQIIFEQEKKAASMPLAVLRGIVRHGGESVQGFFEKEIQPTLASLREGAEHQIDRMFRREREESEELYGEQDASGIQGPPASEGDSPPAKDCVAMARLAAELKDSIDAWQRWVDQRVQATARDAAKLPVRAMNIPALRKNLAVLRARIEDLDERLCQLEED